MHPDHDDDQHFSRSHDELAEQLRRVLPPLDVVPHEPLTREQIEEHNRFVGADCTWTTLASGPEDIDGMPLFVGTKVTHGPLPPLTLTRAEHAALGAHELDGIRVEGDDAPDVAVWQARTEPTPTETWDGWT